MPVGILAIIPVGIHDDGDAVFKVQNIDLTAFYQKQKKVNVRKVSDHYDFSI